MLGGDFPKRRARCTTARSSAARSTARPRLTRPRSCMRKESSFTRCPCCRTSGTDRGLEHLVLANASHALFRCSNYPADIPPQEWHERGHALTVAGALAFHGFDAVMGQTYEVWFTKGDFLYEVSTYKELEPGLNEIMSTWRFI